MNTINDRIAEVINVLGITRIKFGETIGISSGGITQLCNGKSNPSNATINNICREFNVNEEWLRTGEGDMFMPKTVDDEIDAFCGDVKKLDRDDPRWIIMRLLAKLPESDWIAIADIIRRLREE